jgi:hypothetical protein
MDGTYRVSSMDTLKKGRVQIELRMPDGDGRRKMFYGHLLFIGPPQGMKFSAEALPWLDDHDFSPTSGMFWVASGLRIKEAAEMFTMAKTSPSGKVFQIFAGEYVYAAEGVVSPDGKEGFACITRMDHIDPEALFVSSSFVT